SSASRLVVRCGVLDPPETVHHYAAAILGVPVIADAEFKRQRIASTIHHQPVRAEYRLCDVIGFFYRDLAARAVVEVAFSRVHHAPAVFSPVTVTPERAYGDIVARVHRFRPGIVDQRYQIHGDAAQIGVGRGGAVGRYGPGDRHAENNQRHHHFHEGEALLG